MRLQNTGAAFGLFRGAGIALMIVDFAAIVAALDLHLRVLTALSRCGCPAGSGMSLIVAGTSGNLIDRLNTSVEGITDFISIGIWPAFNVADSSITVGVLLLAFTLIFLTPRPGGAVCKD